MDKVALYLRLSKEDRDKIGKGDDSESIINQRLLLTDYAIEHGFQVMDVYADDDYSGLYDDRPEFDRLIRDCKLGKFNIIISKSQARFTRNMEHVEKYLHHDFALLGIRFIGVVDGVDTNVKGNKKARQINGLVNEWYCEDLSESIRSVFKQKMKAGQFLGAFAPYGYLKDPANKHDFVIDEAAADVVRRIFLLYVQGNSTKNICHILEDEGIPNPTVYKRNQGLSYSNAKAKEFSEKYNWWSTTTVKRILGNETYIGKLIQGTCAKASYKDKRVVATPKEKWIVVEDHHAPIVDKALFLKVQSLMQNRRMVAPNQDGSKKVHLFAGKLRCDTCGSTIVKSGTGNVRKNKDDSYLRCQLANKSRLKECSSHTITYSAIVDAVLSNIQMMANPILADGHFRNDMLRHATNIQDRKSEIEEKRSRIKELQSAIDNGMTSIRLLYNDRAKGNIAEDLFFQLKADLEEETQAAKKRKDKLMDESESIESIDRSKNDINELLNKYNDYSCLTHEMVVDFIDYIEIGERDKETKNQEIKIHWNF